MWRADDSVEREKAGPPAIWSQTFSFDAFGNINKTGNSSFGATYSPSTNQMTTIGSSTPSYDANGNVTNDFLHTYAWDANGRPVTIDGVVATYDALGRMVELNRSGVYGQIVYDPAGDKLALMNAQTLVKAFVPLTGGATAVYSSTALAYYRHSDWLGSSRLATTPTQTMYNDVAYAPYGETYAQSGTADFSFTGMNEDVEQNANPATLYDFPAREYGVQGRWPSPDPAGLAAVNPTNPQTWNRYAYVGNNPLVVTDPSGADPGLILCADPLLCFVGIIGDIINFIGFDFGPPPNAPPAPDGGYGTGIDPYGTWDEKLPIGVRIGMPASDCTYGSGSCGGVIYSYTGQAGVSVNGTWWGVTISFFAGIAFDSKGHVAVYSGKGTGVATGAGASGGVQVAYSNGYTVCSLGGPFGNISMTGGLEGVGGTADVFGGPGAGPNGKVGGGGITAGVAGGASSSAQLTKTTVVPIGSAPCN